MAHVGSLITLLTLHSIRYMLRKHTKKNFVYRSIAFNTVRNSSNRTQCGWWRCKKHLSFPLFAFSSFTTRHIFDLFMVFNKTHVRWWNSIIFKIIFLPLKNLLLLLSDFLISIHIYWIYRNWEIYLHSFCLLCLPSHKKAEFVCITLKLGSLWHKKRKKYIKFHNSSTVTMRVTSRSMK